jgi:hypothetical protein
MNETRFPYSKVFVAKTEGRSGEYTHQSALFGLTQCLISIVATFIQA